MPAADLALVTAPARRGRPRKTRAERDESRRRSELVREAARLFRARSFAGTSTRDIAAAAGMQSGSPFYYFSSKSELLFVVMRDGMVQAQGRQDAALATLGARAPARARLRVLIRQHFEVLLGEGSDFIPVMLYEWRWLTPEQSAQVSAQKDCYEAAWMPVLRSLQRAGHLKAQPSVARLFIFGALNWTAQWFNPQGALSLDDLTEQALGLFTGQA